MDARILDLDGSVCRQAKSLAGHELSVIPLKCWGQQIRMACSFGCFQRFEHELAARMTSAHDLRPTVNFIGSGDFHHVTFALLKRIAVPFNLLVLDNHPDWMRGIPFMHCGTWLYHAAALANLDTIFHVGGDVDFDNYYMPLAPWADLLARKIVVFPGRRRFSRGQWKQVHNDPVREEERVPGDRPRITELFQPYARRLARRPLYVSIDKDVLNADEAIVNWDSGHLSLDETLTAIQVAASMSTGLLGADTTGDWSLVAQRHLLGKLMHWTEHPRLTVVPEEADHRNAEVNRKILATLRQISNARPEYFAA